MSDLWYPNTHTHTHGLFEHYIWIFALSAELAKRQEEEAEQLAMKEEGLVAYQQRQLHERGGSVREHTKTAHTGRLKLNEQTKKFMKKEYAKHTHIPLQ